MHEGFYNDLSNITNIKNIPYAGGDMMHKIIKCKCFVIALIISTLFFGFGKEPVFSENIGSSSGIDVVFVIDSSKSMKKSDPEGLTGEAMKMFIDMCHTKGDKGGMVAYSGNIVREYKVKELNSEGDKSALKNTLTNLELGDWTDIGLGLKKAVNILKEGTGSGNKPIIILLSDGKNDPERDKSESESDLTAALNDAKLNKFPIYTIGLNADGTVDKNQLQSISKQTNGKNFITNTAEEIPNILRQIFADNFSLKVLQQDTITGNEEYQQIKINIPDNNAVEANISILASKPVEIKLSNPEGKIVQIPSAKFIYNKSNKYSMLKLISPEKGSWILYKKGDLQDKINISLISNYDLKASIELSPDNVKYKGDKVDIVSFLESNGQKLEDKDVYSSSKAVLIVRNLDKSETKEFPMEYKNNEFVSSYTLADEDRYELMVRIEGSGFIRESEIKTLGAQNRKPVFSMKSGSIRLWNSKNKKIDLSQYFKDPDKDKLKYSILTESAGSLKAEINGDTLNIQGREIGGSIITIICDDSKGGKISAKIKVQVFFASYIIFGVISLIIITVLVILIRKVKNKVNKNIPGYVKIQINDNSTGITNQPFYRSLNSFKRSFSMQELFKLNPAFAETEKITLKTEKNGRLIISNKSQCKLESNESEIDTSEGFVMENHSKITVKLVNKNISITIQYFSS